MLFGVNQATPILLKIIGVEFQEIPRFRDCYIDGDKIVIYTRTGGGNRECYADKDENGNIDHSECYHTLNDALAEKPNYIIDYNDDYDSTYAYFEFKPLEQYKEIFEALKTGNKPEKVSEKFLKLIKELRREISEEEKKINEKKEA